MGRCSSYPAHVRPRHSTAVCLQHLQRNRHPNGAIVYLTSRNFIVAESVILHFGIGWRTYKAHAGVFIISMLTLLAAWIVLEIAVITLQNLGLVVWLILHLAFFFFFAGLMVGFHRLTLRAVEGKAPELSTLTGSLNRGPTFLLAATIYFMAVVCGFVVLIVPGI